MVPGDSDLPQHEAKLWRYLKDDWLGFQGDGDLPQHEAKKIRPLKSVVPRDGDLPQHEAKTMALFEG